MPNPPYFQTGDALTGSFFWVAIRFPHSQDNWIFSQFLAALDNMSDIDAWTTAGETTTSEASLVFDDILNNRITDMAWSIGDIKFTGAAPDSGNWLLCDGSAISQATYAALYARIGATFNTGGEPSGTFRVPDMRGRVAVMTNNSSGRLPSWANAPGGSGGESDHTLTVSEMPSHVHGGIPTFTPTAAGLEVTFASLEIPLITTSTTSTGGDGSHNNIQPSMALACYILADF